MNKPIVGQTVWVKKMGNAARNVAPENLVFSATISKVGNKYFELEELPFVFSIETGIQKSMYTPDYQVYENEQILKDEVELNHLSRSIPRMIDESIPLEILRQINQLLNP